jgi:hypothetical protein
MIGTTVTARWKASLDTTTTGLPAKPAESHVSATGVVESIEGSRVTLNCDGRKVVVERAWIS